MKYLGEHLLPGQIGHFLICLSLVASLLATVSFYFSFKRSEAERRSWLRIARIAFLLETIGVVGAFASLYYIISNHLFEYKYAWQHSSLSLQVEYLLSCFWEGQEGSFMLWAFWHCVLGWILIWRARTWEGPVMTIVSFAQFCLATMVAGIYVFGVKIGSSPFVLLRNEMEAPIFSRPDYLTLVKDGNGLNALLQNYWMVIHPPVLFLGFASTIVPFAYAIGGILNRDLVGWTKPVLPWASFAAASLGLGIMMGAAWAYESLTFGGYWAWDPVENASLVPWLVLISGLHTNLVYRSTRHSLRVTYLFYILTFVLILYSTFLTRSGILGDTSVHAFTDLGMNTQLLLFLLIFLLPALFLWIRNYKAIPAIAKEEDSYSREFWMFIGSLVFFFSALIIIGKTSLPVFNKLFGTKIAPPADVEFSHNQIQVWIAIIVGLLTAVTQYFRYRNTSTKVLLQRLLWPTLAAVVLSGIVYAVIGIGYERGGPGFKAALLIGVFMACFAITGNALYLLTALRGRFSRGGASIAHVGFGMVLLGILVSAGNKETLSINTTGISPLKMKDATDVNNNPAENITLVKGIATDMGRYMVTYQGDSINPRDKKHYFSIHFQPKPGEKGEPFNLYPNVIENNKGGEGLSPNPDARHFFSRDIFAYLTFITDPKAKLNDTTSFKEITATIGDTMFYSNGMWVAEGVEINPNAPEFAGYAGDTIVAARVKVIAKDGRLYEAMPAFRIQDNRINPLPDTVMSQSIIFGLTRPGNAAKRELVFAVKETNSILDFVTLKVYRFPGINLLWLGILVTITGFIVSIVYRSSRRLKTV